MTLNIFLLFFSFMFNPMLSVAQEKTNVILDTPGQMVDSLTSTENKRSFLQELFPTPGEEQFNKILKVKIILAIAIMVGFVVYAINELRNDIQEMKMFNNKRPNK